MKVWIENPFDNLPTEGFRPQRFWLMAEAFAAAGHDVVLWTSDFNHTTKKKRVVTNPVDPRFSTVLLPSLPYDKNVSLKRMFSHWRYAATWEKAAMRHAPEYGVPDVMILSTPPLSTGAAARRLAKKFGARLVFDIMDAWPETFERVAPRWALAPLRRLAKANYLSADLITTVADSYIDLVRDYGYAGDVRRFYHGIGGAIPDALPPQSAPNRAALAYIGNLGRTYDLATVIEALEFLPDATLEIAGQGEQEQMLRNAAAANPRISFRGYLGENEMNALLARCTIGIVPMAPESCVGVPYKFADYSRAGLAIASPLGGESSALLQRYGAGETYLAGDPRDLARAIAQISKDIDRRRLAALKLAKAEFDASKIYADYVSCVEKIV